MIDRLAILGVGLLGGSIALAARARGVARRIVGVGRNLDRLGPALAAGAIDHATTEVRAAVRDADVVVLAATVAANDAWLPRVWEAAPATALVTDVGSTKRSIARVAEALRVGRREVQFVGSHPMAGSERSGYGAARADLFEGATVVVTSTDASEPRAVKAVVGLWEALGARVVTLDPDAHDRAVAAISHLPHLVAWALADAVARAEPGARDVAGAGFRDTTRIAASDPRVWRDILLANADALGPALAAFRTALAELESLVATGDGAALEAALARIKAFRESVR